MKYQRKTQGEYQLFANYGQGWEIETIEETWAEIKARLREYRENAPQYSYKIVTKRVKINS